MTFKIAQSLDIRNVSKSFRFVHYIQGKLAFKYIKTKSCTCIFNPSQLWIVSLRIIVGWNVWKFQSNNKTIYLSRATLSLWPILNVKYTHLDILYVHLHLLHSQWQCHHSSGRNAASLNDFYWLLKSRWLQFHCSTDELSLSRMHINMSGITHNLVLEYKGNSNKQNKKQGRRPV